MQGLMYCYRHGPWSYIIFENLGYFIRITELPSMGPYWSIVCNDYLMLDCNLPVLMVGCLCNKSLHTKKCHIDFSVVLFIPYWLRYWMILFHTQEVDLITSHKYEDRQTRTHTHSTKKKAKRSRESLNNLCDD